MKNMNEIASQILKPTLLLDKSRALVNIKRMSEKAARSGVRLRPHFKTHQSAEIGEWFREFGVTSITVSSVDMAEYFAQHGWSDITLAVPVNLRQTKAIDSLASTIRLGVLIESIEAVKQLDRKINSRLDVWLKVDVGYHRTGILWDDIATINRVVEAVTEANHLELIGILTHAGHTYGTFPPERIGDIYRESLLRMQNVRERLRRQGVVAMISVGDTPGCSIVEDLGEVDEVRPGNFIFHDLSQLQFGACREEDIAIAVACPVIAKHSDRRKIIIYGGAIHLSKEFMPGMDDLQSSHASYMGMVNFGAPIFGRVCLLQDFGWSQMYPNSAVSGLSQEHGVIDAEESLFEEVEVGDLLIILPVHSCLTANLLGRYRTLDGVSIDMFRY